MSEYSEELVESSEVLRLQSDEKDALSWSVLEVGTSGVPKTNFHNQIKSLKTKTKNKKEIQRANLPQRPYAERDGVGLMVHPVRSRALSTALTTTTTTTKHWLTANNREKTERKIRKTLQRLSLQTSSKGMNSSAQNFNWISLKSYSLSLKHLNI